MKIQFDKPTTVYFIGIGGVSMSGLAHILLDRHFKVAGSDLHISDNTQRLVKEGASVFIGQKAENINSNYKFVVYTAAIHPNNPEYQRAKELGIPLLNRKDLLAMVMEHYPKSIAIAGTHGKTTTTAMLSYIFLQGKLDPTISIGANLSRINGNVYIGHSAYFIAEACEYTNSFLALAPYISIITNIEEDHLDFFKDINDIRHSFHKFVLKTSNKGALIIHNAIVAKEEIIAGYHGQVLTYGLNDGDIHSLNKHLLSDGTTMFEVVYQQHNLGTIHLPITGDHNVLNALAAISVALYLRIDWQMIKEGLAHFKGADRRFEKKGLFHKATVIDDYAHHPQEIQATLNMAFNYPHKRLIVVFQPHTYSRTKALFEEFAQVLKKVDICLLAPIYAAREDNDPSISSALLAKRINEIGGHAKSFINFQKIKEYLHEIVQEQDLLMTIGAGDIVDVANDLVKENNN